MLGIQMLKDCFVNKSCYKTIVLNIGPRMRLIGPPAVARAPGPSATASPGPSAAASTGPSAAAAVRECARPVRPQPSPAFYNAF